MGTSRSDRPKALCPVCGRPTVTLKDGRIGRHGAGPGTPRVWPPALCKGWGEMPEATGEPEQGQSDQVEQ